MVNPSRKKRYELWWSEIEESHSFFPEDNKSARNLLAEDAILEWSIEASSWIEAQTKRHQYQGLEPYKPMQEGG